VKDWVVPLGSAPPIRDGRDPLEGGQGSVRIKPGTRLCPEGVEMPGFLDGTWVGMGREAFNA
jgi:hypothetical protein